MELPDSVFIVLSGYIYFCDFLPKIHKNKKKT